MATQPSRATGDLVLTTPKGAAAASTVRPELERDDRGVPQPVAVEGAPARKGTISLNLRLDPALHKQLRDLAYRQDVSIQSIVDRAIREHVAKL